MDLYLSPRERPRTFFRQTIPGAVGILLTVTASYVGLV